MSMELYINDATHTLAICSNSYALILKDSSFGRISNLASVNYTHSHNHSNHSVDKDGLTPKCLIEFVPRNTIPLHTFRRIQKELHGLLGLICLKGTMYVGFISGKQNVGPLTPSVNVFQLINTIFVGFNGEIFSLYNQYTQQSFQQLQQFEETYETLETSSSTSRINSIMKLLETGTFYYSYDTDLAVKAQDWDTSNKTGYSYTTVQNLQDDYAGRFVWNGNLISEISIFRGRLSDEERKIFDQGKFYITLIRGFVQRETFQNRSQSCMTIISRQDCRKIGSLFGPACVDEEGNVANFVETELIIYTGENLVSYSIVKGNVPLFWKLDTHLLSTKIEFPRSQDASKHAFNRFFETLCTEYNMIYVLDALSSKGSQPELSDRYATAIRELQTDYKELSVGYKKLTDCPSIGNRLKGKSDYMSILLQDEQIHKALEIYSANQFNIDNWEQSSRQLGVFLINTLDSNDRANHVECKLSEMILEYLFGTSFTPDIWTKHDILWVSNGAALGKLSDTYNTSIKTKNKTGGLIGKFAEQGKKYAEQSKKYVAGGSSNVTMSSSGRQTQFDRLLGRKNKEFQVELIDPIHDYVLEGLNKRRNEFTTVKDLSIYAVTFNVNAVLYDGELDSLLFPEGDTFDKYDLIAISLEEVIELTPSKVMSIDLRTRNFWERRFKDALNNKHAKEYTLLRGEQLGGILLLVYSSTETIDNIKNVESSVKKTGFKGISANKGGVGITFTFSTHSRICFVASHLAAGQSNSEERHHNYNTIASGLTFKKCKNIKDSDILIWMGDLNYRISLPNETVRKLLKYIAPIYSMNNNNSSIQNLSNQSSESLESEDLDSPELESSNIFEEIDNDVKNKFLDEEEKKIENENKIDLQTKIIQEHNIEVKIEENLDELHEKSTTSDLDLSPKTVKTSTKLSVGDNNSLNFGDATLTSLNNNNSTSSVDLNKQEDGENVPKIGEQMNDSKIFINGIQEKLNGSHTQLSINEEHKVIEQLFEYDQLNSQMTSGQSFPFFDEMEIAFKPTYKFDKGTDYYDTSEKQRVPSWTDRILTHTKNKRVTSLEQLRYNSIPKYKFSDHKPVYGIFIAKLEIVNDSTKSVIEKELYDITKQKLYSSEYNGSGGLQSGLLGLIVSENRGKNVLKHGLPAPSSKDSRWWISKDKDGLINDEKIGKVKIRFSELDSGGYIINPNLPRNPFVKTDEPFFIEKGGYINK